MRALLWLWILLRASTSSVMSEKADHWCDSKPPYADHAGVARYLIHCNSWGVVSTHSVEQAGLAFGNVLSFSDGAYGNSTGRVLMYMADMDSTVADLQANAQATLAVAEAQLSGGCGARDPEDPVCAKVVLMGHIVQVPDDYVPTAKEMVFARHPAMRAWHAHTYHVYELVVDKIRVLDYYGGYGWPSVAEYMAWTPDILA